MAGTDKDFNSTVSILLVDDNQDQSLVRGMLLDFLGFQVQVCNSGSDCIKLAETSKPEVILLDIDMPIMNGFQVCEHIRKQVWGKDLRIIAFTGRDDDLIGKDHLPTGFNSYLPKLASNKELANVIVSNALSKRAL